MGRRYVLEIQDGSQLTGSINDFAGFTDIYMTLHVVPKTLQGLTTTTYETSWPTLPQVVTVCLFSCTALFVSIGQVIGCEDRLQNYLYCVGWGVKLCSTSTSTSSRKSKMAAS